MIGDPIPRKFEIVKNSPAIDKLPFVANTGINTVDDVYNVVFHLAECLRDKKPIETTVGIDELAEQLHERLALLVARLSPEKKHTLAPNVARAFESVQHLKDFASNKVTAKTAEVTRPPSEKDAALEKPVEISITSLTESLIKIENELEKKKSNNADLSSLTETFSLLFKIKIQCESFAREHSEELAQNSSITVSFKKITEDVIPSLENRLKDAIIEVSGTLSKENELKLATSLASLGISSDSVRVIGDLGEGKEGTVTLLDVDQTQNPDMPALIAAKISHSAMARSSAEVADHTVPQNLLMSFIRNDDEFPIDDSSAYLPTHSRTVKDVTFMEYIQGIPATEIGELPISVCGVVSAVELAHFSFVLQKSGVVNKDAKSDNLIITEKGLKVIDLTTYADTTGRFKTEKFTASEYFLRKQYQMLLVLVANTCLEQKDRGVIELISSLASNDLDKITKAQLYKIGEQIRSDDFGQLPSQMRQLILLAFNLYVEPIPVDQKNTSILKLTYDLARSALKTTQDFNSWSTLLPVSLKQLDTAQKNNLDDGTIINFPDSPDLNPQELEELLRRKNESFAMGNGDWFDKIFIPGDRLHQMIAGGSLFYAVGTLAKYEISEQVESDLRVEKFKAGLFSFQSLLSKADIDAEYQRKRGELEQYHYQSDAYDQIYAEELTKIDSRFVDEKDRVFVDLKKIMIGRVLNLRKVIFKNVDPVFLEKRQLQTDPDVAKIVTELANLYSDFRKTLVAEQIQTFVTSFRQKESELVRLILERYRKKQGTT